MVALVRGPRAGVPARGDDPGRASSRSSLGAARLARLMRFVPRSVMTGFVNALAILIFLAQLPELPAPAGSVYAMVAAGLAIIYLLPRLTTADPVAARRDPRADRRRVVAGLECRTVGDVGELPDALPILGLPQVPLTWRRCRSSLPYSLTLAAGRPARIADDGQLVDDITETPLRQGPRVARPGHRQHRHRAASAAWRAAP